MRRAAPLWRPLRQRRSFSSLSWALNRCGVTPSSRTAIFRNEPLANLGAAGALRSLPRGAGAHCVVVGEEAYEDVDELDEDDYDELYGEAVQHVAAAPTVFIEDGCLGTFGDLALPTRLLTSAPELAVVLRPMLSPLGEEDAVLDAAAFRPLLTVYAVPGLRVGAPFACVNAWRAEVVVGGGAGLRALLRALGCLSAHYNLEQGAVQLEGACGVLDAYGGRTCLVVGEGAAAPGNALAENSVVWGDEGVWSGFAAALRSSGVEDAVEPLGAGGVGAHPSVCVLVAEGMGLGEGSFSRLSPNQARFFHLALSGCTEDAAGAFRSLLIKHRTESYIASPAVATALAEQAAGGVAGDGQSIPELLVSELQQRVAERHPWLDAGWTEGLSAGSATGSETGI